MIEGQPRSVDGAGGATQLRRELRAHHLFALSFGTIVGTGWITGLGIWLGLAGSLGAAAGMTLGGTVMILIAVCYAQLARRYPTAGGEIAYAHDMWGRDVAFVTGWCMVLVYITAISFQTVALAWMLEVLIGPTMRGPLLYEVMGEPVHLTAALAALAVGAGVAWLNHRGVAEAARLQSWLTFAKIAISVVFFACAMGAGDLRNLEPQWSATSGGLSIVGIGAVFATAPFFLAGFDVVPLAMGECRDGTSRRAVYVATVGALVAAIAYYALVILCGAALLPRAELLSAELPTEAAFERAFASALLAKLVLAAGLLGVLSCWNSSVFAAGRVLYTMSERRMIPAWFERIHPTYATPGRATLFASAAGLLLLPFGSAVIHPIVNASGSSLALVALIVCLGLLRLRLRARGSLDGGRLLPAAATAGAAFIVCMALYEGWRNSKPGSMPLEWILFGAWMMLGAAFWLTTRRSSRARAAYLPDSGVSG
jgi:amino acid transporter